METSEGQTFSFSVFLSLCRVLNYWAVGIQIADTLSFIQTTIEIIDVTTKAQINHDTGFEY